MASPYEAHLFRGDEDYPGLYLDDVSEIPFLNNISGVEEYQHRARTRAGDGDLFAAVTPPAEGYEDYCRNVLGLGSAELVLAESTASPIEVAAACMKGAAFARIVERARSAGGLLIRPYMSIEAVWRLAARIAGEAEVPVRVVGPPPPVLWMANDKKAFHELVCEHAGPEWLVRTEWSRDPVEIGRSLADIARESRNVALKRTRCASAMGNEVFTSAELAGKNIVELVRSFLQRTEWDGKEDVLAVAWEDAIASPSTQTWIPPMGHGAPVVEGVYQQILEGPEGIFVGSRPASPEIAAKLTAVSLRVAAALQERGYVGRCSFDFILLEDGCAKFTECNGRWGGTSIPMSLVERLVPGPRPSYRAQDFVRPGLRGRSFAEVLERVGGELYQPATGKGRFIFYNVGPLKRAGKLDVIALGDTMVEADEAVEVRLSRLLE